LPTGIIAELDGPSSGTYPKKNAHGNIGVSFLFERYPNSDQVVLDLTESPELWGTKIPIDLRKHTKAQLPKETFSPIRTVQLSLDGKGSTRIRNYEFIVVNIGFDLRPMRYAAFPDHAYHLRFLLDSRPNATIIR